MPVYDRFAPTLTREIPQGYLLDPRDTVTVARLRLHGIKVDTLSAGSLPVITTYFVDSIARSARAFQGHNEIRLAGRWSVSEQQPARRGELFVATDQPHGLLAAYLLEPESDDGLVTWNHFDFLLKPGAPFPVRRASGIQK